MAGSCISKLLLNNSKRIGRHIEDVWLRQLLIATKSDAIRWYLQLLPDSFHIAGGAFFVMRPQITCLTSRVHRSETV
ncbi:hypothetical protein CFP56_041321 [Quercus suber]|uniref:Uncharacterized protein n=1 Tax=Quercus suber TaxID=58331 RepID=A0AAW0LJ81_QUESU